MIAKAKHINDYKLADRYLCGDKAASQELYATIFPILKGFILEAGKPCLNIFYFLT